MVEAKRKSIATHPTQQNTIPHWIWFAVALSVIALAAFIALDTTQADGLPKDVVILSQAALEETYGLRVNLVAVTAAGGMVDLRLKVVDAVKAQALLGDAENHPTLFVDRSRLFPAQDISAETARLKDGSILVVLFSNPRNLVTRNTPVTILFGNIAVEPIESK